MSLIKANAVQIGQSPTATQNFTLAVPSSPDGTIKLARGNAGATTQDVISVDASGNVNGLVKSTGSTTARSLANRFADVVNVKDFGAVGDGVADDTAAIQAAIKTAFIQQKNVYFPFAIYAISSTIIIPQYFDYTSKGIEIDCGNSNFKMMADVTLFTSGYYNSGVLVTNFGTPLDSHYSQGIVLKNFHITSNVGYLVQPMLKIQDWHQGTLLENISSLVCGQMLWSRNNYYCNFKDIRSLHSDTIRTGDRFIFSENHNLNKFEGLIAANASTGYRFDGPVISCQMTNMSFEGQTIGAKFNSTVYDISIENSYIEGIDDVAFAFNSYTLGTVFKNNYINFLNSPTSYFIYYNPLPGSVIRVEESNFFSNIPSDANIIKNREDTYGDGITIERAKDVASSLNDLLIDNNIFGKNINWCQKKKMTGIIANVNNYLIPGNYSGQFSTGYNSTNGFEWINNGNNLLTIRTRIVRNSVHFAYVALNISHSTGPTTIVGLIVGNTFYEFTNIGLQLSTKLVPGAFGAYLQIDGGIFFNANITNVTGEIRII